jgi:hypothetical protein
VAQDVWEANEIEVTVSGFFTTYHRLETAAGTLGEFTFPALRMRAFFRAADGRELLARRVSVWRGRHELQEGDLVLATAEPAGFLRRAMTVRFGGREYALRPDFGGRRWRLADAAGATLLEIRPRGAFRRGAYLTVQGEVDADLLAFAYYLVVRRWKKQRAVAHGGS